MFRIFNRNVLTSALTKTALLASLCLLLVSAGAPWAARSKAQSTEVHHGSQTTRPGNKRVGNEKRAKGTSGEGRSSLGRKHGVKKSEQKKELKKEIQALLAGDKNYQGTYAERTAVLAKNLGWPAEVGALAAEFIKNTKTEEHRYNGKEISDIVEVLHPYFSRPTKKKTELLLPVLEWEIGKTMDRETKEGTSMVVLKKVLREAFVKDARESRAKLSLIKMSEEREQVRDSFYDDIISEAEYVNQLNTLAKDRGWSKTFIKKVSSDSLRSLFEDSATADYFLNHAKSSIRVGFAKDVLSAKIEAEVKKVIDANKSQESFRLEGLGLEAPWSKNEKLNPGWFKVN